MSVINYAHRGASQYSPENTLRAFYMGLEMHANGIETDIQRTKDGVLVLHHDDSLMRIAGDPRAICDCTYDQLLEMDFGVWRGQNFAGERIVTLDTFLIHFGGRGLGLALEIKQVGVEAESIAMVNQRGCRDEVTFTSFYWESMEAIRKADANIRAGFLTERITPEMLKQLKDHGIGQICPRVDLVSEADMELARKQDFSVRFWGIRDEAMMKRALDLKGDGMTCDFPDRLSAALGL